MKTVCKCGHRVTLNVLPDREKFFEAHSKLCQCVECYTKETGKPVGKDTVMVREIEYEAVK